MVFLRPTIVSSSTGARELTQDKFNGIWEFTVSEKLGVDSIDAEINNLFKGLPIREK